MPGRTGATQFDQLMEDILTDHTLSPQASTGLHVPWSWCSRCQRTYMSNTCRVVTFASNALHPHPATLKLCPYADCSGSTIRDGWLWTTVRLQHPQYPAVPERNVVYTL